MKFLLTLVVLSTSVFASFRQISCDLLEARFSTEEVREAVQTSPITVYGPQIGLSTEQIQSAISTPSSRNSFVKATMIASSMLGRQWHFCLFKETNMQQIQASFASFLGSDLTRANLSRSLLQAVDFYGVIATGTIFDGSNLRYSRFKNANLQGASFIDAQNLDTCEFTNCVIDETTVGLEHISGTFVTVPAEQETQSLDSEDHETQSLNATDENV